MTDISKLLKDIAIIRSFLNNPAYCEENVKLSSFSYLKDWYATMVWMYKRGEKIDPITFATRQKLNFNTDENARDLMGAIFGYSTFTLFGMLNCNEKGELE